MATLSGQKVKDAFASLLKLSSNTATTTLKSVESGDGVETALQIGTTKVGVNGTLEFSTVPATGSSELDVLLLNSSNQVIKRTLNTSAFSGGAVTTATLPLAITGSTVRIDNPSTISDVGTPTTGDRFLIWDASASGWRRIDYTSLATFINPGGYQSAPEIVARIEPQINLTTTPQYLDFSNIGNSGFSSVQVGQASSFYSFSNVYGGNNSAIVLLKEGIYEVTLSASLTTSSTNVDVTFFFDINGVTVGTSETSFKSSSDHFLTQGTVINASGGEILSVRVRASSTAAVLNAFSSLHLRRL
jgi:hypothetical protein